MQVLDLAGKVLKKSSVPLRLCGKNNHETDSYAYIFYSHIRDGADRW